MNAIVDSFINDNVTVTMFALIALDLVFGILDAIVDKSFKLSYVADFARNDVLGKVFPWFLLHSFAMFAGSQDIVIPGVDVTAIADVTGVALSAMLVASLLNSLRGLGVPVLSGLPDAVAGDDPASPTVATSDASVA